MTAERPFYVYCHTAPNGKRYIGQTSKEPNVRWANGRGYTHNPYFSNAIKKYGWNNIRHDILCVVHSENMAHLFEKHYIEKYGTFDGKRGYNLTLGGEGTLGHYVSDECKRKISEANTGNTWSEERKKACSKRLSGSGNPMYGRHHSDEMREKMSLERKGKPLKPEQREKVTRALLETIEKQKKPVRQYDLNGNLIATFSSAADAASSVGKGHSSITMCCLGKRNTAHGYRWAFADEALRKNAEEVHKARPKNGTAVIQTDMSGEEVSRYKSLTEAARIVHCNRNKIAACCRGERESYAGYVWRYESAVTKPVTGRSIRQLDLNGNEIALFADVADACISTGVPRNRIYRCCRGLQDTSFGYRWEFANDEHCIVRANGPIGVVQMDMDGNVVDRFRSVTDAMRKTGHDRHRIIECCNGERSSYRESKWRLADAA